ncbi:hypothetical protein [Stappia sp. 28M-7]|uniref:hypothetical protein n=1 Tax=Stappia sp. 28M-7 TaxID=2762596 RepID=UPI00163C3CF6|nr:hypothetical protein [Stappia sp. 28M-7]MBC2859877.1 hypothetical protein [Stappia sp. 28M-7]
MNDRYDGGPLSEHWNRRAWAVPPDASDTLLMNIYHDDNISFFGDLTVYTSGYMQALLRNEPDVPMLTVEQQPPPAGREYIHSMMYWMIIGNHVLTIQSRSLSTKNLEQYLTWLLKERTTQMQANGQVILTAKFDGDEVGGDLDDISHIIVGGTGVVEAAPATHPQAPPTEQEVDQRVDVGARRSWGERAMAVLRAIMSNEADVQTLLENIPEGADLDVSVHIGYKTKKRRVSRAPMQQALRHLPEGEITAIGRHGKMTGKDIRLSYPVRVLCSGSLLDANDVREKLRSAYEYFVANGKINA